MKHCQCFKTGKNKLVRLISLYHSWKTFLLYISCVHITFFIRIRINIQKANYVDFYAINIFVTCECSSGYLLTLCHKPLETIVFNPQFYGHLRSLTLSWKSLKFFRDNCCLQLFLWTDLSGGTSQAFGTFDKLSISP